MNELTLPGVGPGIEAGMIAAVAATVFITGAMKGVLGLGLTTGSIVVFSILYGVESALSLLIAPTIATNIWQGTTGGHGRELLGRFGIGIAAIVPGVWAGSLVVGGPHTDNAERVLGAVLVLYAFSAIARREGHYEPKREEMMTALAGALNGLVTGATGILVIPMIPYIERIKLERDALVQMMAMVFCTSALALAITLAHHQRYDPQLRNLSLWAIAPALPGVMVGEWIRKRMSAERFRKWFMVALGGVGAKLAVLG